MMAFFEHYVEIILISENNQARRRIIFIEGSLILTILYMYIREKKRSWFYGKFKNRKISYSRVTQKK